jgi:DGQHR domain-containing protein
MENGKEVRVPALEISQGPKRLLYSFGVDGKQIPAFAAISRISRSERHRLRGYQRPEVLSHIAEIRRYLESASPMIPNSIVVAFDSRVQFVPGPSSISSECSRAGTLVIPADPTLPDEDKPGWIVDGQQRVAAIREANVSEFPIFVVGFITKNEHEQREQFILVNSTRPLPKGLIYELLPATKAHLPTILERRRYPAALLDRLDYDADSPLRQLIRTPTTSAGVIRDNSILKMLENSLSDGVLYRFRDAKSGKPDTEEMLAVLKCFWGATKKVFHDAWEKPPRESRLMHGAGIDGGDPKGQRLRWVGIHGFHLNRAISCHKFGNYCHYSGDQAINQVG